jgi:2-polyprenyl-6-methoxyphenol hydroxylase-like FAD-dependent oxidoreductase
MRFVVAGGGFAGLAAALAVARAGHEAVVIERDAPRSGDSPQEAFAVERRGIPHFHQPHAFLPRGRQVLRKMAPDVVDELLRVGAEEQDLANRLRGPVEAGDEDLTYLWVRRPVIEWALRRAASTEKDVELRAGSRIASLLTDDEGTRVRGVGLADGTEVRGDVVVDALGRYRPPAGWPRSSATPHDSGAIYYCRYFELQGDAEHLDWPLLNPRGDLGYMGFNVFRGDNRTYAIILLVPAADHDLRILKHERSWMAACERMRPLDVITGHAHGRPITDVMPMGGLMNVDRTAPTGIEGLLAVGDAFCHTDPAFAWGLSFSLAQAEALAAAAAESDPADVVAGYRESVVAEARERYELACAIDDARSKRWAGEPVDVLHRDGCYPLFSFTTALAAAPYDDDVMRRAVRRIGLLDRTQVFDQDVAIQERIESIAAEQAAHPPDFGPPRDELLATLAATRA